VKLKCENQKTLNLIIDTGAQISSINRLSLRKGTIYHPENKCNIVGISPEAHSTLGDTELTLSIGNQKKKHNFQILQEKNYSKIGRPFGCRYTFSKLHNKWNESYIDIP
jgi:hypothetical protein